MTMRTLVRKPGIRSFALLCLVALMAIGPTTFAASDAPRTKDRAPLGGSPRPLKLPQVQDTALPNGLQVRVVEDHRFPLVTMKLAFRFGTTADPGDLPGLCESTAELLREGTAKMKSREIADELAAIGGSLDSESGPDTVSLTGSSLSEFADRLATLMAETTTHPSFPDSEVALRKENLKQELAQNRAQPSWLSRERFQREIYGTSPYAVISPTDASIEKLDRSKIADFHHRMFVPGSAVLVVVGDVDRAAMLSEVTAAFGSWSGQAAPAPSF